MFPNAVAVLCNMCTRDFPSLLFSKVDILPLCRFNCCPSSRPGAHTQRLQTKLFPECTVPLIIFPFQSPFHLGAALSMKNPGSGRLSALNSLFVFDSATSSTLTSSLTFII